MAQWAALLLQGRAIKQKENFSQPHHQPGLFSIKQFNLFTPANSFSTRLTNGGRIFPRENVSLLQSAAFDWMKVTSSTRQQQSLFCMRYTHWGGIKMMCFFFCKSTCGECVCKLCVYLAIERLSFFFFFFFVVDYVLFFLQAWSWCGDRDKVIMYAWYVTTVSFPQPSFWLLTAAESLGL